MSLQKYQALITSIECGSITKAAEVLGYTQSGVSRMIQELEKEWNLSLIERSKSGVFLTSDGFKLFDQMKRICNEQLILSQYIDDLNDCQSGLLRIGVFSSVATHWLPNIMKRYKNDFPKKLLLGLSSQSPKDDAHTCYFTEVSLKQEAVANFRIGKLDGE